MKKLMQGMTAPDFELKDTNDQPVKLSDFRGKKRVVLVLMRGFVWPYCRRHLAQLRHDYQEFVERNVEVIALGPDGPNAFKRFWQTENMPFIGLADIKSTVASQYHQEINWFKAGRMPAVLTIDLEGNIRFIDYGEDMTDIPQNETLLAELDQMN